LERYDSIVLRQIICFALLIETAKRELPRSPALIARRGNSRKVLLGSLLRVSLLAADPTQAARLRAHIASAGSCRVGDDPASGSANHATCKRAADRIGGNAANHTSGQAADGRAAERTILPCGFAT
jgi:hypothetical protein